MRFLKNSNLSIYICYVISFHLLFHSRCIINCTKQNTAVLRGIRQSCKVNTVTFSVLIIIRAYSQPRNYGFNTAVGTGYAMGKNTVAACIHQDQTLVDGQAVKLRLLEPMQAGNIVVPKNTLVAGTAKVQGERLDILVSSIEYAGNIIPVELAVFDTDGQKGLSVPSSMEQEAFNEAMANIGSGLGTSISFAQSAGQQVAMDVTRGLLQGTSGYLAKKFRTVKVKLKAGYKVMLYAKQQ